jgi:hypothetical protein
MQELLDRCKKIGKLINDSITKENEFYLQLNKISNIVDIVNEENFLEKAEDINYEFGELLFKIKNSNNEWKLIDYLYSESVEILLELRRKKNER